MQEIIKLYALYGVLRPADYLYIDLPVCCRFLLYPYLDSHFYGHVSVKIASQFLSRV